MTVLPWYATRAGTEHLLLPRHGSWGIACGSCLASSARVKSDQAGFALIGSLIVASVVSILLTVAQKVTAERRHDVESAEIQLASVLAEQKLRELNVEPLSLSPNSSLEQNVAGFVDYLDRQGVVLGGGPTPGPKTAYIRRWSVSPVPANPESQVVIRVLILPKARREPTHPVHLMMVKSRVAD